jgi:hypothetical protein
MRERKMLGFCHFARILALIRLVVVRISLSHFMCRFDGRSNLNQLALSDSWAIRRGLAPLLSVGHQFRPEGKEPALRWFSGMNHASLAVQEMTLGAARLSQPDTMSGAIDIPLLELGSGHLQVSGRLAQVAFSEVDPTLLLAALRAT